ncbi:MAG: asparagine--tRNA ligase, partial [Lachnospiraceae bacterium]|nr:asparagine--tRNA ligase [Lachnospiraceae bacterium]
MIDVRDLFERTDEFAGKSVRLGGWIRTNRDNKNFGFLVINDGTYQNPVQVVYHDTMENFTEVAALNVGAAVIVTGEVTLTPEAKQPFEIQAQSVEIEGASDEKYP